MPQWVYPIQAKRKVGNPAYQWNGEGEAKILQYRAVHQR